MKVDYIIPVYKPDEYRKENLKRSIEFVKSQKGVDVNLIVVEQDLNVCSKFNKPWLCNLGVRQAKTEHIIIGDMDIVNCNIDSGIGNKKTEYFFCSALELITNTTDWGFLWNRLKYVGKTKTDPLQRVDFPYPGINEGGIVYYQKELWKNYMGGANECLWGLGGPDNDVAMRAQYITGYSESYPATLIHQWHPISKMKKSKSRNVNREILKYTRRFPDKTIKMLKKENWGNPKGPYSMNMSFYEMRKKNGYA